MLCKRLSVIGYKLSVIFMTHEEICERIFEHACRCLKMKGFTFKPKVVHAGDGYVQVYKLGYTDLASKLVVIDIYTQKLKKTEEVQRHPCGDGARDWRTIRRNRIASSI